MSSYINGMYDISLQGYHSLPYGHSFVYNSIRMQNLHTTFNDNGQHK